MEKVAGVQFYPQISASVATNSGSPSSPGALERSPQIRGHHSSVNKAMEAHRQLVEQRQTRHGRRDMTPMNGPANSEIIIAQQISDDTTTGGEADLNAFENTLIESPSSQAKMASIQSFQSTEPDRPTLGEPVPKGSYLDIEA